MKQPWCLLLWWVMCECLCCSMEEVVERKRLRWAGSLYVGARDGALEYRLCVGPLSDSLAAYEAKPLMT